MQLLSCSLGASGSFKKLRQLRENREKYGAAGSRPGYWWDYFFSLNEISNSFSMASRPASLR